MKDKHGQNGTRQKCGNLPYSHSFTFFLREVTFNPNSLFTAEGAEITEN